MPLSHALAPPTTHRTGRAATGRHVPRRGALGAVAVALLAGCAAQVEASPTGAAGSPAASATAEATGTGEASGGDGATRTVVHARGTTEVPADAERVVVLDTGELDAVVSLGVVPVGAVTSDVSTSLVDYLGPELEGVAPVGTIGEPNLEAVAALDPDLVLSNTVRHEDLYDELSAIAPTVFAADVGDTWKETLRLAAEALGEQPRAEQLLAGYEQRAAEVGDRLAGGDPGSFEVSVVRFLPGQTRAYGQASFVGTVLADAGLARPEQQQVDETFVEVSPELLSGADGDLLVTTVYGDPADTDVAAVTAGPLWQQLGAVRRGDVLRAPDDTWMLGIGVTAAHLVLDDLEAVGTR